MDEKQLAIVLKDKQFIKELVKVKSRHELINLFKCYDINLSLAESQQLRDIIVIIKKELNKADKQDDDYLQQISGGKSNVMKYVSKPFYYASYGLSYAAVSAPIVGYTIYHSVKDAIRGYYDALKN